MEDIYTKNGFKGREDYLKHLSENYGVDLEMVQAAADMLGPNEDFDGLVTCIEDYSV